MNAEPNYMTSTIINTGPLHEKQSRYGDRLSELKKELKEAKRNNKHSITPTNASGYVIKKGKKKKKSKKLAHYMFSTIVKGGPNLERTHYSDRDGKQRVKKNTKVIKPLEMSVIEEENANADLESAAKEESEVSFEQESEESAGKSS